MKTLAASLTAHQKLLHGRVPAVSVVARAERYRQLIHRWSRLYTGSETDVPHAIVVHDNGTITRARISGAQFSVQTIASPSGGSAWSTWTNVNAARNAVALWAIPGTSGEVWAAYVNNTSLRISVKRSTDYGVTWGVASDLAVVATLPTMVAIYMTDTNTGLVLCDVGAAINRSRRSAGVWGAMTAATPSGWTSYSGIAIAMNLSPADNAVILTGVRSADASKAVVANTFNSSNSWSEGRTLMKSDTASTITFYQCPSVAVDANGTWYVTASEKESAGYTTGRAYLWVSEHAGVTASYGHPFFSEGVVVENDSFQNGAKIAFYGTAWWLSITRGIWSAAAAAEDDLSARVLSVRAELAAERARAVVLLDNSDELLTAAPNGSFDALQVGGTLRIRAGYTVSGTDTFGTAWSLVIERLRYIVSGGTRHLEITAVGPWERAADVVGKHAVAYAANVTDRDVLFREVFARVSVPVRPSASDAPPAVWSTHDPAFVWPPGETAASALHRLLVVEAVGTYLDDYEVITRSVSSADTADFTFDEVAGGHNPVSVVVDDAPPSHNWVRIVGPDRYYDAENLASIYQHGARMRQLREGDATDNTHVAAYGDAALRRHTWEDERGELVAAWHAGLEPLDVVGITVAGQGLSASLFRVLTVGLVYDRAPGKSKAGRYDVVLKLGSL